MKENYKAWDVNHEDFYKETSLKGQLLFLVRFAVLAPSSHNTQPWKFEIKDSSVLVFPDFNRALPVSDENYRQLYISLGCALENLLQAADYYDFKTQVEFSDAGESVKISFEKLLDGKREEDHPALHISKRQTNRNKYEDKIPDQNFINWASGLAGPDIRIDITSDKNQKNKISDVVLKALIVAMDNPGFRLELSHYLKSNITNSKVGMPASGFGIPAPVSLFAPRLIRRINMNRLTRRQDEALLKEFTPAVCIISTRGDDKKSWIQAGRIFERIALFAEMRGMKTAPMAAAVEIGEFYKNLQEVLGINFRPQVFFRLGYCKKPAPYSPRLTFKEVTYV